jgi:NAD(P)-dependent dehydrogenase (short-subunit alcohol dehydrogenase family)
MGRLDGKVAAITGGASGIGEATVRLFVEEGAKVAFADRDGERGKQIAAELEAAGADALFVQADMQREAEAMAFIQQAEAHFGQLHILVNNAGIRMYQNVVEASEASWDTMLGVNLKGYAFCAKAAIPAMQRAGGGSIVSTASIRSIVAGSNTVQYDTTKAAVAGLTRAMARDHAADGIRVNAVGPGPILTRFHERRAAEAGQQLDAFAEAFGAETMLKRPGTPREVANCILFLASDEASFVTGTILYVDGGKTAM